LDLTAEHLRPFLQTQQQQQQQALLLVLTVLQELLS
jgi:hypothetical protein